MRDQFTVSRRRERDKREAGGSAGVEKEGRGMKGERRRAAIGRGGTGTCCTREHEGAADKTKRGRGHEGQMGVGKRTSRRGGMGKRVVKGAESRLSKVLPTAVYGQWTTDS